MPPRRIRFAAGAVLVIGALTPAAPAVAQPEPVVPHRPSAHHKAAHATHATSHTAARHAHLAHPPHPPPRHVPPPAPPPKPPPVVAALPPAPPKGSSTGLPLPRFASLRADDVNLRGGPGTRYPIQWVYKRRDLPVEIEREFDVWRLIEDSEGVKGWVHQATLVGTRSFVIRGGEQVAPDADQVAGAPAPAPATPPTTLAPTTLAPGADLPPGSQALRSAPAPDAPVVAVLDPGVVGRLRVCAAGSGWCRVSVKEYSGWLPRDAFWGLLPDETILPP